MPEYLPEQRWWYEEAYSLLRLERAILGLRLEGFLIVPGAVKGALAVVQQRLDDLRWLSWDAVALAERSLVYAREPCMRTWWDRVYRVPHSDGPFVRSGGYMLEANVREGQQHYRQFPLGG